MHAGKATKISRSDFEHTSSKEVKRSVYENMYTRTFEMLLKQITVPNFIRMSMKSGLLPLEQRQLVQHFKKLARK